MTSSTPPIPDAPGPSRTGCVHLKHLEPWLDCSTARHAVQAAKPAITESVAMEMAEQDHPAPPQTQIDPLVWIVLLFVAALAAGLCMVIGIRVWRRLPEYGKSMAAATLLWSAAVLLYFVVAERGTYWRFADNWDLLMELSLAPPALLALAILWWRRFVR